MDKEERRKSEFLNVFNITIIIFSLSISDDVVVATVVS